MRKVVIVPKGIDLVELFSKNGVRQERSKKRLRDKIYYFLSKVVTYEGNIDLFQDSNGFRPISNSKMDEIFGTRDSRNVLKILTNPNDPIIECNNSYQVGNYPKGYRLTEKYRTGQIEFKTLNQELSLKLQEKEIFDPSLPDYSFLKEQFNLHPMELSPEFEEYLYHFGNSLQNLSTNKYQKDYIHNKVGRILLYQEKIKSGKFQIFHSNSNNRFHSILTNSPKELRGFFRIGGMSLVEIDLGSSQPYLLAVILKELHRLEKSNWKNDLLESTSFSISSFLINTNNELISKVYPFMSRTFLGISPQLKESIRKYYTIPFDKDFYEWVQNHTGNTVKRNEVKNNFMYFLFDQNPNNRNRNTTLKVIGNLFPGVNLFIELLHEEFGESDFARFLQMVESHLLINVVLREFHISYPHIPLFTIHDSFLTTEAFAPLIKIHLEERLKELTSIPPKTKITSPAPLKIVLEESINNEWTQIKKIKTKKQYEKLKHTIFKSNISRGEKFLVEKSSILRNREGLEDFF